MNAILKRLAVVGIAAGSLTGIAASLDSAQALPIAAAPTQATSDAGLTPVQYYPYGYRRYYRPYRRFYRGPAGVYRCGPYQLHTRLQRKACR